MGACGRATSPATTDLTVAAKSAYLIFLLLALLALPASAQRGALTRAGADSIAAKLASGSSASVNRGLRLANREIDGGGLAARTELAHSVAQQLLGGVSYDAFVLLTPLLLKTEGGDEIPVVLSTVEAILGGSDARERNVVLVSGPDASPRVQAILIDYLFNRLLVLDGDAQGARHDVATLSRYGEAGWARISRLQSEARSERVRNEAGFLLSMRRGGAG